MEANDNPVKNQLLKKTADGNDASLMLAKEGSFLWTGKSPASRYQGWFLAMDGGRMIKVIEDIRPRDRKKIKELTGNFAVAAKAGEEIREIFNLPEPRVLFYEMDKFAPVEIFFDIKDIYDSPEFGRNYRVWKEDGAIVVNFNQECRGIPEIFAAIWGDFGIIEIKEEWIERNYEYDRRRNDAPAERWVFKPAEISASRIAIAAALTKEEAINKVREAWNRQRTIGGREKLTVIQPADEAAAAKEAAAGALGMLKIKKGGSYALRAGLPWFFQVWRRDEAVSLKGLLLIDPEAAKEILWRQMDELAAEGYRFAESADAIGWLFLRAGEMIKAGKLGAEETQKIFGILEMSIRELLAENTKNDLAINGPKLTWMDSLERSGAAIEIQALRLNMYDLAARIADSEEKKNYYHDLEAAAWIRVREKFFRRGTLADLFDPVAATADFRERPNVFLAAYAYPQLLSESEWTEVFDKSLEVLWCDWGGLGTLGKNERGFRGEDAGADPVAYHNGDSWFWVNNLAAVVLNRLNNEKNASFVNKIFEASKKDILRHGAMGCASEISPAEKYEPAGCVNQAWSNATFLELAAELKR